MFNPFYTANFVPVIKLIYRFKYLIMKKIALKGSILILMFTCFLFLNQSQAQLLKRIQQEVKNRVENKAVNETGKSTDKAMDNAIGSAKGNTNKNRADASQGGKDEKSAPVTAESKQSTADYNSYDFVPGDKIIFQPDLSAESDAELPARFTIKRGNAEIQSYGGEKILHLNKGGQVTITPLMDNDNYLPAQFTLEFDMMYENDRPNYFASVNDFAVRFFGAGDNNYEGYGLSLFLLRSNERVVLGDFKAGSNLVNSAVKQALNTNNVWHHIALYVRKNIAKAYIGSSRVAATNNFPVGAAKVAILTDGSYGFKIKNVRLAAGGDDKYNKIVTEGKFITHGITFDVNKSTIKPESMGALNEIAKLMTDHGDLNLEVNGHTDSDGNAAANMKLSEERAAAVRNKLIEMGINASRLTIKGNGSTQPIDNNKTQEGKANNRRVEFVKK